jgi:hypothetical protein
MTIKEGFNVPSPDTTWSNPVFKDYEGNAAMIVAELLGDVVGATSRPRSDDSSCRRFAVIGALDRHHRSFGATDAGC